MNEDTEKSFSIPVKFSNIPGNIVLEDDIPDDIKVRIKDKGLILLNYSIKKRFTPIDIDFSILNDQDGKYVVNEAMLLSSIKKQLKLTSSILGFTPQQLKLPYSTRVNKKVPVKLKGEIIPKLQSRITENKITLTPDSVQVFAPESKIGEIECVYTDSIYITEVSEDLTKSLSLEKIEGASIIPSSVSLFVPIEEYTEKRISLPVDVINMPDTLDVRIFPSNIQVSFFVGLSDFKGAVPDSFRIVVDYNDVILSTNQKAPLSIISMPSSINNVRLHPDSIEYIIEIR